MPFEADVELPDDIHVEGAVALTTPPRRVLLTGANGFLGVFLLREILRQTPATVHCLVRGADARAARGRLSDALKWYRLDGDMDMDRVVVEPGDLAEPEIGLRAGRFGELAATVDTVYHAGALVNANHSYSQLRPVNIHGLQQVLRLAALHTSVPVHFMSTGSVFPPSPRPWQPDDVPASAADLRTGYSQSKWVGERILGLAAQRGLPVSTYRIDRVWGDQRAGACQTDDFFWLSLKGCLQAGAVPVDAEALFTVIPADYAAEAVVALSLQENGRTLHLSTATPLRLTDAFEWLRDMGYRLDRIPRPQWMETVRASQANEARRLVDVFDRRTSLGDVLPISFDSSRTDLALGYPCPPVTRELFETYVRFQVETGWLPDVSVSVHRV